MPYSFNNAIIFKDVVIHFLKKFLIIKLVLRTFQKMLYEYLYTYLPYKHINNLNRINFD